MRDRLHHGVLSLLERGGLAWEGLSLAARDLWRQARPVVSAQCARTRAWPIAWSFFYVALFCLVSMAVLDRPVAYFFKAHVGGEVEGFFKLITRLGEAQYYMVPAGLLWIGLMVASLRAATHDAVQRLRRLSFLPAFLFLSIAVSGLISNAVKFSLGRFRPRYLFESGTYGFSPFNTEWGMNSFPSGHTQAVFAAMTALMVMVPRYDLLWMLIAVLVGLSRVLTTVHYLSDAVAGAWLAMTVTILLARAFRAKGIEVTLRFERDRKLSP